MSEEKRLHIVACDIEERVVRVRALMRGGALGIAVAASCSNAGFWWFVSGVASGAVGLKSIIYLLHWLTGFTHDMT